MDGMAGGKEPEAREIAGKADGYGPGAGSSRTPSSTATVGGWGEQLLNAVATQSVRYLFSESEFVAVRVHSRSPQDLFQGRVEGFEMEGRGLVIRREFPVDSLAFRTDPVAIEVSALLRGQLQLQQPTQAIATVCLSEANIERMFAAALVRQHLQGVPWQRGSHSTPGNPGAGSPESIATPGTQDGSSTGFSPDDSPHSSNTPKPDGPKPDGIKPDGPKPDDSNLGCVNFEQFRVTLQPHNHVRLQVVAHLLEQVLPLTLTATLKLERRRRIRFQNLQLETDRLPLAQVPRAEKLRGVLAAVLNGLIDVERWQLDGVLLRLNQMETAGSQLRFKGYAQINHFPRQG